MNCVQVLVQYIQQGPGYVPGKGSWLVSGKFSCPSCMHSFLTSCAEAVVMQLQLFQPIDSTHLPVGKSYWTHADMLVHQHGTAGPQHSLHVSNSVLFAGQQEINRRSSWHIWQAFGHGLACDGECPVRHQHKPHI